MSVKFNSFKVNLPWPHKGLSPNARVNRYAKAKLFKQHKITACVYTKKAMLEAGVHKANPLIDEDTKYFGKKGGTINLRLICTPPKTRYRDEDNLIATCKAFIDGVAEALRVNDCCFHFREQIWKPADGIGLLCIELDWMEERSD